MVPNYLFIHQSFIFFNALNTVIITISTTLELTENLGKH